MPFIWSNPQQLTESGFYDAYSGFSKTLRGWFVAYGIGAPVFFASQASFAKELVAANTAKPIIILFLIGVVLQILLSVAYKYCMWFLYRGEIDNNYKRYKIYKISDWLASQTWLEFLFDLASLGCFAYGTIHLLFATLK
jgi:hypothetical protein